MTLPHTERIAFASTVGGTGRTTAAVMLAAHLARSGRQVLLADLNTYSPGSRLMLGYGRGLPRHGLTDALAAPDDAVGMDLIAPSVYTPEYEPGAVWVAPAYGTGTPAVPGDSGRAQCGATTPRVIGALDTATAAYEQRTGRVPDVLLIDLPAGLDPIAMAVMSDTSDFTFLFTANTADAWGICDRLFATWLALGQAPSIREHLRIVSAMSPGVGPDAVAYQRAFRERSWETCSILYDDDMPDPVTGRLRPDVFHPSLHDDSAAHAALPILFLPSLFGSDSASLDAGGWQELVFVNAAFKEFVSEAAALVNARTAAP